MAKDIEATFISLRDKMNLIEEQTNSLYELMKMLKAKCTKAYRSGMSFMIRNLKTSQEVRPDYYLLHLDTDFSK